MTKGFIFTLDAALAAVLGIVLLFIALNLSSVNTGGYFGKLQLASAGNDFLAVLEQTGVFDKDIGSQSYENNLEGQLSFRMTDLLPPNYCANISVYVYKFSNGFVLDKQVINVTKSVFTGCPSSAPEYVNVKRSFLTFDPEYYGKIDMLL